MKRLSIIALLLLAACSREPELRVPIGKQEAAAKLTVQLTESLVKSDFGPGPDAVTNAVRKQVLAIYGEPVPAPIPAQKP